MKKQSGKNWLRVGMVCALLIAVSPMTALASIGPGFTAGSYVASITADSVNINVGKDIDQVLMTAKKGDTYEVLEDLGNGWVKVRTGDADGYLPASGNAQVYEVEAQEMAQVQKQTEESSENYKRQKVAEYGLQFVGGKYKYGGSNPHTGTDCSGFTKYVMEHGAGIHLERSSRGQARQGVEISADQMRPGDLLFYGNGKNINHVGMYIGNGQIVHASTEETGIITSPWNYRNPVKIVNVMG